MDGDVSAPVVEFEQPGSEIGGTTDKTGTQNSGDGADFDQAIGNGQQARVQGDGSQPDHNSPAPVGQEGQEPLEQENKQMTDTNDQEGNFPEDGQDVQPGDPNQDEQQNEDQETWNNYGNQQYQWNGNYQWYPQQGGYYYSGGYGGDGPRRYNDYYYGGPRGGYRGGPPGQPRNNFRRPISPRNSGYGNYRQSQPYHHRYYDDSEDAGGVEGAHDGYRQGRGYQFSRYYNSDRSYQTGDWDEKNNFGQDDAGNNDVIVGFTQKDSTTVSSQAVPEKDSSQPRAEEDESQQEKPVTQMDDSSMAQEKLSGTGNEAEPSIQKETYQSVAEVRDELEHQSQISANVSDVGPKNQTSLKLPENVVHENLGSVEPPTEAQPPSILGSEDPESKNQDSELADTPQPSKEASVPNEANPANANHSSPPRPDRSNPDHHDPNRSDYSDSYHYSSYSGHYNYTPQSGITKFYVGRILTDTNEEQIRQAFMPFGDVFEVRIIKKAYNGQPLRETYYAFVLISLHKTVKEVTQHFDKNQSPKGWNVSLAKESSRSDDYHSYREGSPTRKRRGDFGSPGQPTVADANGFSQPNPNLPPNTYPTRGGRVMSSAERNMGSGFGPNKFYRDRWNDGRSDQYPRENWDPSNGRCVLINLGRRERSREYDYRRGDPEFGEGHENYPDQGDWNGNRSRDPRFSGSKRHSILSQAIATITEPEKKIPCSHLSLFHLPILI